jgi:hypothetical protein
MAGYRKSNASWDTRKSIVLPFLKKFITVLLHLCFSNLEACDLFQPAFTLVFFSSLKVSEVVALGLVADLQLFIYCIRIYKSAATWSFDHNTISSHFISVFFSIIQD